MNLKPKIYRQKRYGPLPIICGKDLLKKVAKDFFWGNPVKIALSLEGQNLTDSNNYLLGCKIGPVTCITGLLHEMCHLAEREPNKLLKKPTGGWGFGLGKFWQIMGHRGWEMEKFKDVEREARVWSYQLSLQRELGIEESAEHLVSSATYLPGFCNFKYAKTADSENYSEREEEALKLIAETVRIGAEEQFTFPNFKAAWDERMKLLA